MRCEVRAEASLNAQHAIVRRGLEGRADPVNRVRFDMKGKLAADSAVWAGASHFTVGGKYGLGLPLETLAVNSIAGSTEF